MDDLSKLGAFSDYVDWYLLESNFLALIRYLALMRAQIYAIHCINYACKKTEVAYHVRAEHSYLEHGSQPLKLQPLQFFTLCLILAPAIVLSQPANLVERVFEFQVAQNLTPLGQRQIELLAELEKTAPEPVPAPEPDVNNQVAIPISGAYVGMNTGETLPTEFQ